MKKTLALTLGVAMLAVSGTFTAQAQPLLSKKPAVQIAEDIEILSKILQENLQVAYQRGSAPESFRTLGYSIAAGLNKSHSLLPLDPSKPTSFLMPFFSDGVQRNDAQVARPMGVYLPDYGIVLQVEVPAPADPPKTPKAEQAETSDSQWDRARRSLQDGRLVAHGVMMSLRECQQCHEFSTKAEPNAADSATDLTRYLAGTGRLQQARHAALLAMRSAMPNLDQVIDVVLETLAENGHNLRQLDKEEKVCVVLSYRPTAHEKVNRVDLGLPGAVPVARAALPSRVLITASKSQLDVARAEGKRQEFKKAVKVERFIP